MTVPRLVSTVNRLITWTELASPWLQRVKYLNVHFMYRPHSAWPAMWVISLVLTRRRVPLLQQTPIVRASRTHRALNAPTDFITHLMSSIPLTLLTCRLSRPTTWHNSRSSNTSLNQRYIVHRWKKRLITVRHIVDRQHARNVVMVTGSSQTARHARITHQI